MGFRLIEPEAEMVFQRGKAYSQDLRERVFAAAMREAVNRHPIGTGVHLMHLAPTAPDSLTNVRSPLIAGRDLEFNSRPA